VPGASGSYLPKWEHLQIARNQKELAWKAVAQPHQPMAMLAQRHRDWGCLLLFPPQNSKVAWNEGVRAGRLRQLAPKMRTSADSSQPEESNMESCCTAPSAHGNARTEEQRLGLLACLATSNFKRILGGQ